MSSKLQDPFRLVIVHLPSQRGCSFLAVGIDNHTGSRSMVQCNGHIAVFAVYPQDYNIYPLANS